MGLIRNRLIGLCLVLVFGVAPSLQGQVLPQTELGDIVLRALDDREIPDYGTYVGHAGLYAGWIGVENGTVVDENDPAKHYVYDLQRRPGTNEPTIWETSVKGWIIEDVTVRWRTFASFASINDLLGTAVTSYDGGFGVPEKFSATTRQRIIDEAEAMRGSVLVAAVGASFTKDPTAGWFRCDALVEYVYEQALVRGGGGIYNESQSTPLFPVDYATDTTIREFGVAPSIFSVTQQGGPTQVEVSGETGDSNIGSGIRLVEVSIYTPAREVLDSDLTPAQGEKPFSFSLDRSQIPSGVRTASLQSYDRAGNRKSEYIDVSFLSLTLKTPELATIPDGGVLPFDKDSIIVEAIEAGEFDPNPGSGVDKFVLTQTAGGTRTETKIFEGTAKFQASHWFQNIEPGAYKVEAFDRAGNVTTAIFYKSPLVQVFDGQNAEVQPGGFVQTETVRVDGEDFTGDGLDRIVLAQTLGGSFSEEQSFTGQQTASQVFPKGGGTLPDGTYEAKVFDASGNNTSVGFNIADPLFLVGGRKLIFSERAIRSLFAEKSYGILALTGRGARLYLPKEAA